MKATVVDAVHIVVAVAVAVVVDGDVAVCCAVGTAAQQSTQTPYA